MNRQPVRIVLAGLAAALLLAGCGSQQPAGSGAAGPLQERVRTVRQLATEQNHEAALAELDGLSADVAAAAARGDLSAEQQQRAGQALDAVRADLQSMAAEAVPADAPATGSPAPPDAGSSGSGRGQDEDCDDEEEGRQAWHDDEEDRQAWHDDEDDRQAWHDGGSHEDDD